ncbi:PspC domain-containing protein [Wangella sp. NEAU-J3]|nr:PspC domain-containing protein [Jidongwangia harbinensis]
MIAGVCAAVADRFGLSRALVRVAFFLESANWVHRRLNFSPRVRTAEPGRPRSWAEFSSSRSTPGCAQSRRGSGVTSDGSHPSPRKAVQASSALSRRAVSEVHH